MTARRSLAALALAAVLSAGCVKVDVIRTPKPATGDAAAQITAMLEESTRRWDAGDLDGFLTPYMRSGDITFVGSTGLVRGKDATRAKYASSYFASGAPKDRLSFRDVEVRMLGTGYALAVGRYVLTDRQTNAETTGWFSLTLMSTPQGWRIIHDHSS